MADDDVLIRRVVAEDAITLRDVRLRALRTDPASFGSTYERELDFEPARWEEWAREDAEGERYATLLALAGDEAVGIVNGARDDHDPELFHVYAMWVAPESRGRGVARRLLGELEGWIRGSGGTTAQLSVTTEAAPAQRLYESAGYEADGHVEQSRHTPGLIHVSLRKRLR